LRDGRRSWSEEPVAFRLRAAEYVVDRSAICVERTTQAFGVADQRARTPADGWVVGRGEVVVEKGVLHDQGEAKRREAVIEELDDHELGGGEETLQLVDVHFFRAGVLGLGGV